MTEETTQNVPIDNREKPLKDPETGRFLPGNGGGPGRPPGSLSITNLIREELMKVAPGEQNVNKKKFVQLFIERMLEKAIRQGDHNTQKLIWNYIDGLPAGSWDITSKGEKITNENSTLANQAIAKFLNGNTGNITNESKGEDTTSIPVL